MSGFLETALSGVETAFSVGSQFVRVGTYRRRGGAGVYNPVTDTVSGDEEIIENVRFLPTSISREEREASPVAIQDVKFIVPSKDLPDVTPGESDVVEFDGGEIWNILTSKFVPGNVVHILFARRA